MLGRKVTTALKKFFNNEKMSILERMRAHAAIKKSYKETVFKSYAKNANEFLKQAQQVASMGKDDGFPYQRELKEKLHTYFGLDENALAHEDFLGAKEAAEYSRGSRAPSHYRPLSLNSSGSVLGFSGEAVVQSQDAQERDVLNSIAGQLTGVDKEMRGKISAAFINRDFLTLEALYETQGAAIQTVFRELGVDPKTSNSMTHWMYFIRFQSSDNGLQQAARQGFLLKKLVRPSNGSIDDVSEKLLSDPVQQQKVIEAFEELSTQMTAAQLHNFLIVGIPDIHFLRKKREQEGVSELELQKLIFLERQTIALVEKTLIFFRENKPNEFVGLMSTLRMFGSSSDNPIALCWIAMGNYYEKPENNTEGYQERMRPFFHLASETDLSSAYPELLDSDESPLSPEVKGFFRKYYAENKVDPEEKFQKELKSILGDLNTALVKSMSTDLSWMDSASIRVLLCYVNKKLENGEAFSLAEKEKITGVLKEQSTYELLLKNSGELKKDFNEQDDLLYIKMMSLGVVEPERDFIIKFFQKEQSNLASLDFSDLTTDQIAVVKFFLSPKLPFAENIYNELLSMRNAQDQQKRIDSTPVETAAYGKTPKSVGEPAFMPGYLTKRTTQKPMLGKHREPPAPSSDVDSKFKHK